MKPKQTPQSTEEGWKNKLVYRISQATATFFIFYGWQIGFYHQKWMGALALFWVWIL